MSVKPVVPRAQARRDVEQAVVHYDREAGPDIALGFIDSLAEAYSAIGERPGIGSPRYAHEIEFPGLRSRRVARYPFLIFYIERDDHIDVWRVLHAQRDIPVWLQVTGE